MIDRQKYFLVLILKYYVLILKYYSIDNTQ